MTIRFQADADLNQVIVSAVVRREPAIEFRTATAAGLSGVPDSEVLARVAADDRILVTHDQTTMPRHFGEFVQSQPSPGLIVVPQHLPLRQVVDDILLIWTATEAREWVNRIAFLPI
jgi:hypothetical protein